MRILTFLSVCLLATLLPVQGDNNVFDAIVAKVHNRLGHRDAERHHIQPRIPEHGLREEFEKYKPLIPHMPSIVIPTQSVPPPIGSDDHDIQRHEAASSHHCKECVRWTSSHILKATVNATLEFCAETKCPKLKVKCDWIVKNLNFSVGYIAQRIRPVRSATLYCEGAKRCLIHHKNQTFSSFFNHDNDDDDDEFLDEEMNGTGFDDSMNITSSSTSDNDFGKADLMDGIVDEDIQNMKFLPNVFSDEYSEDENGIICAGCVHLGASHIVTGIWARTATACKDPKNPKWAARCEWTFNHKEFSTGYIYARFRPGKFSYGYCMGKGICPHPKPSQMSPLSPMFNLNF